MSLKLQFVERAVLKGCNLTELCGEFGISRQTGHKWLRRYRKVVVMSERDAALLDGPNVAVIPNGVDLARFAPEIERPGERLLFIG